MNLGDIFAHEEYNERIIANLVRLGAQSMSLLAFLEERDKYSCILIEECQKTQRTHQETKALIGYNHRLHPHSRVNHYFWMLLAKVMLADVEYFLRLNEVEQRREKAASDRASRLLEDKCMVIVVEMSEEFGQVVRASRRVHNYLGYLPE
jgi:hypothetical protein